MSTIPIYSGADLSGAMITIAFKLNNTSNAGIYSISDNIVNTINIDISGGAIVYSDTLFPKLSTVRSGSHKLFPGPLDTSTTYVVSLGYTAMSDNSLGIEADCYKWNGSTLTETALYAIEWNGTMPNLEQLLTRMTNIQIGYTRIHGYSNITVSNAAIIPMWNIPSIDPTNSSIINLLKQQNPNTVNSNVYIFGVPSDNILSALTTNSINDPVSTTGSIALVKNNNQAIRPISYYDWNGGGYGRVACLTGNCTLLTPSGTKNVSDLKTGDTVKTHDGRSVTIIVKSSKLVVDNKTAPYKVNKGTLYTDIPANDLFLSPLHGIRLTNNLWMNPITASKLKPGSAQQYGVDTEITYYFIETPDHFNDHLVCNGSVVESYAGNQLANVKQRLYTYVTSQKAYTRLSSL
jgi:hypothetical protein